MSRFHRSLIRVVEVREDRLRVVIPGWSSDAIVTLRRSDLDKIAINELKSNMFLIGDVTIGAQSEERLQFRNVEIMTKPGQWQAVMSQRLLDLGYNGFEFGPGDNWWAIGKNGEKVAGPFTTPEAFDAWLSKQNDSLRERDRP